MCVHANSNFACLKVAILPYLYQAQIQRVEARTQWLHTLDTQVQTDQPHAYWGGRGKRIIMNAARANCQAEEPVDAKGTRARSIEKKHT